MTDDGFIGLPPGMTDSSTVRRARPEPTRAKRPEIVFVPTAPGAAPVLPPHAPDLEPEAAVTSVPVTRWQIDIPGRGRISVSGTLFLGRNPAATADAATASVVVLDDPAKSVSKTHARLDVVDGRLLVRDLDSTNGVWVVPVGGEALEVVPGTPAVVPDGADLELGEFVVRVVRA